MLPWGTPEWIWKLLDVSFEKICGFKRDEVIVEWRTLHNEEVNLLVPELFF